MIENEKARLGLSYDASYDKNFEIKCEKLYWKLF